MQIGFVVGAITFAAGGIADSVPSRRLLVTDAVFAAVINTAVILVSIDTVPFAYGLSFLTRFALASVYPRGMKAMAGWFGREGYGAGALVGALTVGSAGPISFAGSGWSGEAF